MMRKNRKAIVALLGATFLSFYGCQRDVRLADHDIHAVAVKEVTLYGLTLNQQASPQQVAYAAMRAVRDDFLAQNETEREEALKRQFDVCAPDEIVRASRSSLTRNEQIYNVVYHWTPTISHYVDDLPTTWDDAKNRLVIRKTEDIADHPQGAKRCELAIEVKDPSGNPNAKVVMLVWLAQDKGYWRVLHFGFDHSKRTLGQARASTGP